MIEIYKEYKIRAYSNQLIQDDTWDVRISIMSQQMGTALDRSFSVPDTFSNKEEALNAGIQLGKQIIDRM